MKDTNTICAISTPPGSGGVAMIRLSGDKAIDTASRLFRPSNASVNLKEKSAYTLTYGVWTDCGGHDIDDVMVGIFRAPHSYTGEDTIEVSCHGSIYIQQEILRSLVEAGCNIATPGEFTQRAFINGKLDLSQAEAVADLIASTSSAAHRLALNQMRGGFSSELKQLRERLLEIVSLLELELDFGEEDVMFADRNELCLIVDAIRLIITRLVDSFRIGNAIKQGVPVAIIGETNVGKSTLLNRLLHEEKAIVSDIHGTTRDAIEDTIILQGILFRFIDTAGIRQTSDAIETIGIERTFQKIEQASIVIRTIDGTHQIEQIIDSEQALLRHLQDKQCITVVNKSDLITPSKRIAIEDHFMTTSNKKNNPPPLFLSAKTDPSVEQLEQMLLDAAQLSEMRQNDVIVTNIRHYEALKLSLASIERVSKGLLTGLSGDFVSQDLRECLHHLSAITGGEITTDEILGSIFSRFCIGK